MGGTRVESKTRILLVDDHPLFREGLKAIIRRTNRYEIAGEAGNGREGLRLALERMPHLILLDISLPDQSGIQLTREFCRLLPEAAVMIISVHCGNNYYAEAFEAGAKGYLVKEAVPEKLLRGLEALSKGGFFLDEPMSSESIEQIKKLAQSRQDKREVGYSSLTPRQREVLELLAMGYSYKAIGEKLYVSPRTVEKHRANIMSRLQISSRSELTSFAVSVGLIGRAPDRA